MKKIVTAVAVLAATPVSAADWRSVYPIHVGSHVLDISGPTGNVTLVLDGKPLRSGLKARSISVLLDYHGLVDGIDTVAIYDNRGGASCEDGDEVLIAAPVGRAVVVDRVRNGGCGSAPKVAEAAGRLVVVDPPADKTPGSVWLFNPHAGAVRATSIGDDGPGQE